MFERTAAVINETGLHARPATEFVHCAKTFQSTIQINREGEAAVNAKSVVLLLTCGFSKGDTVYIRAEGVDEEVAVNTLVEVISGGFYET